MPCNPRIPVAVLSLILLAGCGIHTTSPTGWLPTVKQAPMDVYGSWLDVELDDVDPPRRVLGELLAANQDTLWVLAWNGPVTLATSSILAGRVYHYDPGNGEVVLYALVGTLTSPLMHGIGAVFSMPIWWFVGIYVADQQYQLASVRLPVARWNELSDNARFPRGIPPGLDLEMLVPRMPLKSTPPLLKSYMRPEAYKRGPRDNGVPGDF